MDVAWLILLCWRILHIVPFGMSIFSGTGPNLSPPQVAYQWLLIPKTKIDDV